MILLDTDHLSVLTDRRAAGIAALVRRLESAGDTPALPIVAVEEQCKGWLAKLGRTRDTILTPLISFGGVRYEFRDDEFLKASPAPK